MKQNFETHDGIVEKREVLQKHAMLAWVKRRENRVVEELIWQKKNVVCGLMSIHTNEFSKFEFFVWLNFATLLKIWFQIFCDDTIHNYTSQY